MNKGHAVVCAAIVATAAANPRVAVGDARSDSQSKTWEIDCDRGESIGKALRNAHSGDWVSVAGTCNENVLIPEGVAGIHLDGKGLATIVAADPSFDVVQIYGDDIEVRGFRLTGGRDGVNLRGALNITVANNTIDSNSRIGINVHRISFALIVGNTIRTNGSFGIALVENASARIGFEETTDAAPQPNIIEDNGASGIFVARSSNAFISGNTIRRNARDGVHLEKSAQAEVTANLLEVNGLNGVFVTQNSGVHLGTPGAPRWSDLPNTSAVPNKVFGLQCSVGAYLVGSLGALNGTAGGKDVTTGCVDTLR